MTYRRNGGLPTTSTRGRCGEAFGTWRSSPTAYIARRPSGVRLTFNGKGTDVETVVDWFRRDEEGRPMPAEWRELMGQIHAPWAHKARPEASEIETLSNPAADPVEA